jgi:hypothetical protein
VWRTLRESQGRTREQARKVFETIVVGTMMACGVTPSTGGVRLVESPPPVLSQD